MRMHMHIQACTHARAHTCAGTHAPPKNIWGSREDSCSRVRSVLEPSCAQAERYFPITASADAPMADPTCVGYDFRSDEGIGHLCTDIASAYAGVPSYRVGVDASTITYTCGPGGQYCTTRDNSGFTGEAATAAACRVDATCVAYDHRADVDEGHLCTDTGTNSTGISSYKVCARDFP